MKQCSHAWNKRHKHGAVTSWISEPSGRIMQLIQDCPAIPQNWKTKKLNFHARQQYYWSKMKNYIKKKMKVYADVLTWCLCWEGVYLEIVCELPSVLLLQLHTVSKCYHKALVWNNTQCRNIFWVHCQEHWRTHVDITTWVLKSFNYY